MGMTVSLTTTTGDNIYITKHNGLKSVDFTENMTNSVTEPFCGVVLNSGRIVIEDKNLILKKAIEENVLQKSGFKVVIGEYDNTFTNIYCSMTAKQCNYAEDNNYTVELSDVLSKWQEVEYHGANYVDRENTVNLYDILYSCLKDCGYIDVAEDLKNDTTQYFFPKSYNSYFPSTLPYYLKNIFVPYTYLDKSTLYDTVTKICKAAMLVCFCNNLGKVKFIPISARRDVLNYGIIQSKSLIEHPFKDVVINNIYDKVSVLAKNAKEILEYGTNVTTINETVNNYSIYRDADDAYPEERYKFNTFNFPNHTLFSAAIAVNNKYYHTFNIKIPKFGNDSTQENLDVFYGINQDGTPKIGVFVTGRKRIYNTYVGVEIGYKDTSKLQIQSGTQSDAYITIPTLIWINDKLSGNLIVDDAYTEQFSTNDKIDTTRGNEYWLEEIHQKGHPDSADNAVYATTAISYISADGRSALTPIIQNIKTSTPIKTADGGWQFSLTCVVGGNTLLCATGRNPENYSITTPSGSYWRCSYTTYDPISIEFSFNGTKKVISLEDKYVSSGNGTTNVYLIDGESSLLSENSHLKVVDEENKEIIVNENLAQYVANSIYNSYKYSNGKHTIFLTIVNGEIKGQNNLGDIIIYKNWGRTKTSINTLKIDKQIINCDDFVKVKGIDESASIMYKAVSISTSYDGQLSQKLILQEI